ncbi:MAG: ATP-binding cassette domain-containing protein [Pseudomonadota bacterium]
MIEIRAHKALDGFTLDVDVAVPLAGGLGLVGPSGSGKSTLLACIAGHTALDAGRIILGDRVLFDAVARIDTPPARRGVGIVFQDSLLFPHLRVRANLLYGARRPEPWLFERLVEALALEPLLDRRPASLSGGERQRVALGRALLARPRLLLLDEPLASLDRARAEVVLRLLADLRDELAMDMIYVSHAPAEIAQLASRVLVLDAGRVVEIRTSPTVGGRREGAFRAVRESTTSAIARPQHRSRGGGRRRAWA